MLLWLATSGVVGAQETVIIGGGLPAVEVNTDALYGALPSYPVVPRPVSARRGPDGLPVFDDSAGPPRSMIIGGAATRARAQAAVATPVPLPSGPVVLRPPTPRTPPATTVARAVVEPAPMKPEPVPTPVAEVPVTPPPPARVEPVREPEPEPGPIATPMPEPESAPEPAREPTVVSGPVAAEPAPEPEPRPDREPEPTRTQIAATSAAADRVPDVALETAPTATISGDTVAITFEKGGADLAENADGALTTVIAALEADANARLQLKAYADGSGGSASAARRLSLSRALAVRSYLIDSGVSSTRIDVRALGAKYESGPPDRVDVISVK